MAPTRLKVCYLLISVAVLFEGCSSGRELLPITDSPNPDKKYYSELLTLAENAVQENPASLEPRIKLATYHQTLDWPAAADANIEAILRMAPKDPQVMVLVADYYIQKGDFERSWIYAQQADRLGSIHPSLSLIKSKYYYSRRNFKEASRYLGQYFESGGKLPEAYTVAAELELQNADTVSALAILQEGVTSNPGHPKMTSILASLYEIREEYAQLVSLIEGYANVTNDHLTYREDLLEAYFKAEAYQQASNLAYNWPETSEDGLFEYGNLLMEYSMYDSVNWYADRMIARDSLSVQARILKGRYFNIKGRLGDAYNYYNVALSIDSTNQIAVEERRIVAGKIAYLRKIRAEQAAMPEFNLTPKKSDN